jgi:hypothetical protein
MQQSVFSVRVINSILRNILLGADATFGIFVGGCSVFIDGQRVENFSNQSQDRLFDLFMNSLDIRNSNLSRIIGNQGALLNFDKSNFTIEDSVFVNSVARKSGTGRICQMKGGHLISTNVLWGTIESPANGVVFYLKNLENIEFNNNNLMV